MGLNLSSVTVPSDVSYSSSSDRISTLFSMFLLFLLLGPSTLEAVGPFFPGALCSASCIDCWVYCWYAGEKLWIASCTMSWGLMVSFSPLEMLCIGARFAEKQGEREGGGTSVNEPKRSKTGATIFLRNSRSGPHLGPRHLVVASTKEKKGNPSSMFQRGWNLSSSMCHNTIIP